MKKAYKLINNDCIKALKKMPKNLIDLTVTSPPYDNLRTYDGDSDWKFDYHQLGKHLYRVTKKGGVAVVIIGDATLKGKKSLTSFSLAVDWCSNGWNLFECCIYSRFGNPGPWWLTRFRVDHEYIFMFVKGKAPKSFYKDHMKSKAIYSGTKVRAAKRMREGHFSPAGRKNWVIGEYKSQGTIWKYSGSNTEVKGLKFKHPATFPNKLAEDLIITFSKEGDIVLDPMCGSGTTCAMALKNKRKTVGIEISKKYCKIARYYMKKGLTFYNQVQL